MVSHIGNWRILPRERLFPTGNTTVSLRGYWRFLMGNSNTIRASQRWFLFLKKVSSSFT